MNKVVSLRPNVTLVSGDNDVLVGYYNGMVLAFNADKNTTDAMKSIIYLHNFGSYETGVADYYSIIGKLATDALQSDIDTNAMQYIKRFVYSFRREMLEAFEQWGEKIKG